MIITKDGQEDRPLLASFVDLLQSNVGISARERQKRAVAELVSGGEGGDSDDGGAFPASTFRPPTSVAINPQA